jgi:O-succinylbenzoic acid--CoA ligase
LSILETGEELDGLPPTRVRPGRPTDDDVLTILFTSGTTAAAKAVMLTNGNHAASARAVLRHLDCRATDRWLSALPLYHVGGLSILVRSAISGMTTVLHPRFDATAVDCALFDGQANIVSLVATMLARLLAEAGSRRYPATLRAAVLGGGPVAPALVDQAESAGMRIVTTYGLTETASQITATAVPGDARENLVSGDARENPGSAGRPLDGVSVRIEAPDSSGVGEILVRGPQVMAGYFDDTGNDANHGETARAPADGWLRTGDLGRIDRDGRLFVVTRLGDVIVTGGEKVVPDEVEAVLMDHPAVADAGVFGRPDPEWGQRVCAAIVLRGPLAIDESALREWCAKRLATYKIPRRFELEAELPRTVGGKLRRRLLAERAAGR